MHTPVATRDLNRLLVECETEKRSYSYNKLVGCAEMLNSVDLDFQKVDN